MKKGPNELASIAVRVELRLLIKKLNVRLQSFNCSFFGDDRFLIKKLMRAWLRYY